MGLCGSTSKVEDAVMARFPRTIQGLGIQSKLDKWLDKFTDREDGVRGRGRMHINDFLALFDFDVTPWSKRVFNLVDADGGGTLDFREFVFSVWNYLTMDKQAMTSYVYDVFSAAGNQFDLEGMGIIIQDVYGGTSAARNTLTTLAKKLDKQKTHRMSRGQFMEFCHHNSSLLFPVVNMQRVMQEHMFGQSYWNTMQKKRLQQAKSNPKYLYPRWRELLAQLTRADDEVAIRSGIIPAPPSRSAGAGAGAGSPAGAAGSRPRGGPPGGGSTTVINVGKAQ